MDKIRILQLGKEDWRGIYELPEMAEFTYADRLEELPEDSYEMVFLDRTPLEEEIGLLHRLVKAHTLFVTDQVEIRDSVAWLCDCKQGQRIASEDIREFLLREVRYYYPKPYGEKYEPGNIAIAQGFSGSVKWNGKYSVTLQGEFGDELCQAAFWRNNIPVFRGQVIDLWLEYRRDSEISISLEVTQLVQGSISQVTKRWEFSEEELRDIVRIDSEAGNSLIFVSLRAKGRGTLQIIALHDRYSRGCHGYFLPGGRRYVTSEREEIFSYFDPGDRRPPLNVYFSGYKTRQGFEGYSLMRNMGCPFLLIAEPRLDGGSFYMGSQEYESLLTGILKKHMEELGFTPDQVILSGLSMGTFGALYYGCDIAPRAILLGKPLASIGSVAANEKHLRPGGFPTSLDVLRYLCGDTDRAAVMGLNERFWKKFDAADWSRTKFIVSYMLEDDYDPDAYEKLISHLYSEGVQVYGKGIHGRHNDNTSAIVNWFSSQFRKMLREDFDRRVEK